MPTCGSIPIDQQLPQYSVAWNGFGYQLMAGYPRQNYSSYGLTATAKFIGPAHCKWAFLDNMFGRWSPVSAVDCNWVCLPTPKPYIIEDYGVAADHYAAALWPDTWEAQPYQGSGSVATPVDVAAASSWFNFPVFGMSSAANRNYSAAGQDAVEQSCLEEITIRYKQKWHATWPPFLFTNPNCLRQVGEPPESDPNCQCVAAGYPTIPSCTFLETKTKTDISVQSIPGRHFQIEGETLPDNQRNRKLEDDRQFGQSVMTTTFELTWSNVPAPNFVAINELQGTVNAEEFLCFPKESVLFFSPEFVERQGWYTPYLTGTPLYYMQPTYDVKMMFVAKTSPVLGCDKVDPNTKVKCSRVGVWNRVADKSTAKLISAVTDKTTPCLDSCHSYFKEVVLDACTSRRPFLTGDFDRLFTFGGLPTLPNQPPQPGDPGFPAPANP